MIITTGNSAAAAAAFRERNFKCKLPIKKSLQPDTHFIFLLPLFQKNEQISYA